MHVLHVIILRKLKGSFGVVCKHEAVKSNSKLWILEFLGFSCGENKRRRKDKRKEELIMRKTGRRLSKRSLTPGGNFKKRRADADDL